MNKTLHMTLKKKWFDMILSGEKKEEYREFKPYWIKRLICYEFAWDCKTVEMAKIHRDACPNGFFKPYDTITFKNGYAYDAPEMVVECKGIHIDYGLSTWGAELGTKYFVLSLGEILSTKNIKQ